MSEYKNRVAMEDDAMSRGFRHDEEVQAGRVEFIIEAPSWGTRWSVDEQSSEGRRHYSGWFASKEKAEQFVIERKAKLGGSMITAYFRDEEGNTLTIDAPTFAKAYQEAVDQGFYVYDYDTEEWTPENEEYNRIDQRLRSNGSFWGSK